MTGVPEILTNASKVIASLFKRLTTSPRLPTLISKKLTRNAKRMTIPPKGMTAIFQRLAIIPGMQVTFSKMLTSNPKMMTSGFHEMTSNFKNLPVFSRALMGSRKKLASFSSSAESRHVERPYSYLFCVLENQSLYL